MLNWDIGNMSKLQEEMLRQAEKDHLVQEVVDDMRKLNPHYNPTLAWVGRRIMDIGAKLVQISSSESDEPDVHAN